MNLILIWKKKKIKIQTKNVEDQFILDEAIRSILVKRRFGI